MGGCFVQITSPIRNFVDIYIAGISPLTGVCRATWTQPSPGQTGKRISSSGRSTGGTPTRRRTRATPSSSARGLTASRITSTPPSCGPAMGRSTSSRARTTGGLTLTRVPPCGAPTRAPSATGTGCQTTWTLRCSTGTASHTSSRGTITGGSMTGHLR